MVQLWRLLKLRYITDPTDHLNIEVPDIMVYGILPLLALRTRSRILAFIPYLKHLQCHDTRKFKLASAVGGALEFGEVEAGDCKLDLQLSGCSHPGVDEKIISLKEA